LFLSIIQEFGVGFFTEEELTFVNATINEEV